MSVPSQFPSWLTRLKASERICELPDISRGRHWAAFVELDEHPTLGDWTAGSFSMVGRASPDAEGEPLVTFTCATGAPAGGKTRISITLAPAAQTNLPPDGADADGVAEIFYEMVYTLATVEYAGPGGRLLVTGAI